MEKVWGLNADADAQMALWQNPLVNAPFPEAIAQTSQSVDLPQQLSSERDPRNERASQVWYVDNDQRPKNRMIFDDINMTLM